MLPLILIGNLNLLRMNILTEKDLFVPKMHKDLRRTYPELGKVEEFKKMNPLDVKFCWYYAIFYGDEKDNKKRVQQAIAHSWREGVDKKRLERFLQKDFPDDINAGIKKFESFDIGSRLRAKFAAERILYGFEKLAETDVDTVGVMKIYGENPNSDAIGEKRDWNQVNAYVNSMVKVNESLPELLRRVEEGFGIRASRTAASVGEGIRDRYQEIIQEQSTLNED